MTASIPVYHRGNVADYALVDDEDVERLKAYNWGLQRQHNSRYAYGYLPGATPSKRRVLMHNLIMDTPSGMECDHVDLDGLNNVRQNLRNCTPSQNTCNTVKRRSYQGNKPSSVYKGVSWHDHTQKWEAYVTIGGKLKYLGVYASEKDAARAYNIAAHAHFGEFARLNITSA
jgi:hypothetical protein